MAIPSTAKKIDQPLDPADILDFAVDLTIGEPGDKPPPFLLTDESVASFVLSLTPEAVAAGLLIKQGDGYPAPSIANRRLVFWLAVDDSMQGSPLFNGSGLVLGIELTATTNSAPPRRKQRTLSVTVVNQ